MSEHPTIAAIAVHPVATINFFIAVFLSLAIGNIVIGNTSTLATLPSLASVPLRRASPFAKATEDKTEDKLIHAKGFMGFLLSVYTVLTYQAQCHRRRKLSLSPESEQ